MRSQSGQVVLILVLVMTVALAIGISVIQRSLSDISTSSKVEQSSRAFSAAEAGIEKALNGDITGITPGTFDNNATATITGTADLLPIKALNGQRQLPLEYPPLAKEEVAHIWLIADINDISNPPAQGYNQSTLDVYWGNSSTDKAALELTLVYYASSEYKSQKYFYDQITRTPDNKFTFVSCSGGIKPSGFENTYQCKQTITFPTTTNLMLLRARLLYNTTSQPFAVQAVGTCGSACSITPQARILTSTGTSGGTQRKVRLFQILKVVPPYFDYAIFSAGPISK